MFLLAYDHIDRQPKWCLEPFMDAYCQSILHAERRAESLLARKLMDELCRSALGVGLSEAGFGKDEKGKPRLGDFPQICLSVTHSDGHVWVALHDAPFGMDFERILPEQASDLEVAFHPADWGKIDGNFNQLYHYFCLKEAYSKMIGTGFLTEPALIRIDTLKHHHYSKQLHTQTEHYQIALMFSSVIPENLENQITNIELYLRGNN